MGSHEHAAYLPPHAVRAARGEVREGHEVVVPGRADAGLICQVQLVERGVQSGKVRGGVQDFYLRAGSEGGEVGGGRVVVFVVAEDEGFEGWWWEGGGFTS